MKTEIDLIAKIDDLQNIQEKQWVHAEQIFYKDFKKNVIIDGWIITDRENAELPPLNELMFEVHFGNVHAIYDCIGKYCEFFIYRIDATLYKLLGVKESM